MRRSSRAKNSAPDSQTSWSVVLPAHNVGPALAKTIELLLDSTQSNPPTQIIVVDDGSTDDSIGALTSLNLPAPTSLHILTNPHRQGKGVTLRKGLATASSQLIGYIDADCELDPTQFPTFITLLESGSHDVVVGHRIVDHPRSLLRRLGTSLYDAHCHRLLNSLAPNPALPSALQPQVGLKLFRGSSLKAALPLCKCRGFAIDVELIAALIATNHSSIAESPVLFTPSDHGNMTLSRALQSFYSISHAVNRISRTTSLPPELDISDTSLVVIPAPKWLVSRRLSTDPTWSVRLHRAFTTMQVLLALGSLLSEALHHLFHPNHLPRR